jgi:hypothetical protein
MKGIEKMSELIVKTDHKWKQFKYDYEVPKKVLDDYDWLDEDEKYDHWIHYRKWWYHLSDFMRIDNNLPFDKWHGYMSDSYFSGVLIEISKCSEGYRIGRYYS